MMNFEIMNRQGDSISLDENKLATLRERFHGSLLRPQDQDYEAADVWYLGGASARVSPSATAFYNRHYPIMIGIEANWSDQEPMEMLP